MLQPYDIPLLRASSRDRPAGPRVIVTRAVPRPKPSRRRCAAGCGRARSCRSRCSSRACSRCGWQRRWWTALNVVARFHPMDRHADRARDPRVSLQRQRRRSFDRQPEVVAKLSAADAGHDLMPESRAEWPHFAALAVTAKRVRGTVFRGFVTWALAHVLPSYVVAAFVQAALLFRACVLRACAARGRPRWSACSHRRRSPHRHAGGDARSCAHGPAGDLAIRVSARPPRGPGGARVSGDRGGSGASGSRGFHPEPASGLGARAPRAAGARVRRRCASRSSGWTRCRSRGWASTRPPRSRRRCSSCGPCTRCDVFGIGISAYVEPADGRGTIRARRVSRPARASGERAHGDRRRGARRVRRRRRSSPRWTRAPHRRRRRNRTGVVLLGAVHHGVAVVRERAARVRRLRTPFVGLRRDRAQRRARAG